MVLLPGAAYKFSYVVRMFIACGYIVFDSIYINEREVDMKILQNTGIPIYQQISEQLKADILSGQLKQGEYLPSIRKLAKELKISVITTMKAYEQLEAEGLVTAMQGKGFYVNAQDEEMIKEQHLRKVEEALINAIQSARIAGISGEEVIGMLEMLLSMEEKIGE